MMKKNIVVILIVISVIGVVLYLLKDRLKALLGERAEGKEIKERKFVGGNGVLPPPGPLDTVERVFKEPTAIYDYAAGWIGGDFVVFVREIYPPFPEHGPVLESLVTYKKGQVVAAQLPPTTGITIPTFRQRTGFGPYSYGLPQF